MPRRISSDLLFLYKFVFPGFAIGATVLLAIFGEWSGQPPTEIQWLSVWIMPIIGIGLLLRLAWKLRSVAIDEDNLVVSSFTKSISIPWSEVVDVSEFLLSEPRIVTLHLRHKSDFGAKILFLAPYRSFAFLKPHPIVNEILQYSAANRSFRETESATIK